MGDRLHRPIRLVNLDRAGQRLVKIVMAQARWIGVVDIRQPVRCGLWLVRCDRDGLVNNMDRYALPVQLFKAQLDLIGFARRQLPANRQGARQQVDINWFVPVWLTKAEGFTHWSTLLVHKADLIDCRLVLNR